MTELEFLDDTVRYYSEDVNRRCVDASSGCYYSPATVGKKSISDGCAIGRFMTKEQKRIADNAYGNLSIDRIPSRLIPAKLKKFSMRFLKQVQALHDSADCWNKKGLSTIGKKEYNRIKKNLENKMYV